MIKWTGDSLVINLHSIFAFQPYKDHMQIWNMKKRKRGDVPGRPRNIQMLQKVLL